MKNEVVGIVVNSLVSSSRSLHYQPYSSGPHNTDRYSINIKLSQLNSSNIVRMVRFSPTGLQLADT